MNLETPTTPSPGNMLAEPEPLPHVLQEDIAAPELPGIDPNEKFSSEFAVPAEPQSNEFTSTPAWLHEPVHSTFPSVELADPLAVAAETTESKEHASKTRKLGKLASRASVQVVKALDKVITRMGAVSVLYPGSSLLHAENLGEVENYSTTTVERAVEPTFEVRMTGEEARLIETHGYVKAAPEFKDQIADKTRTNRFRYAKTHSDIELDYAPPDSAVEMTEHEGLIGLEKFLKQFIKHSRNNESQAKRILTAEVILEKMTFIGGKEYAEAARGIGEYWKAYLDADPERQLCVPARISRAFGGRKSDAFLSETIINGFTDEELERYSGRLVAELEDITAEPDKVKIVLLDDWTISGSQMQSAYASINNNSDTKKYSERVEINVLAASFARTQNGLPSISWDANSPPIPLRAYYLSHDAPDTTLYAQDAHISGTHSSVDFDFEESIRGMVRHLENAASRAGEEEADLKMPPLTHIIRKYYASAPTVVIQRDHIVRKKSAKV